MMHVTALPTSSVTGMERTSVANSTTTPTVRGVDPAVRWGTVAAVGASLLVSATYLGLAGDVAPGPRLLAGVAAILVALPLEAWLVRQACLGRRPAHGPAILVVVLVVVVGALPVVGVTWLPVLTVPALVVLLVVPRPWAWWAFVLLMLAPVPLGRAMGFDDAGLLAAFAVSKALAIHVVVLLVAAVARLDAARVGVAATAVAAERQQLADRLSTTVRGDVARLAGLAAALTDRPLDDPGLSDDVAALTATSRDVLARTRHTVHGLQGRSAREEVDAAAALLRAVGHDVRVAAAADLPDRASPRLRAALRGVTAALLDDDDVGPTVLRAAVDAGEVRVELVRGDGSPP